MTIFSTHHEECGEVTMEDWMDTIDGRNPSFQVRVKFKTFTQAVPITYLFRVIKLENYEQLKNPIFLFQTRVVNGRYSTFWKSEGQQYVVYQVPLNP